MRWAGVLGAAAMLLACRDNPNIDGSKVPPLGSNPTCVDVCGRIVQLCGYAPLGANCTSDGGDAGYCDTLFTTNQMTCIGQATSCAQVWDTTSTGCAYVPPTIDAGDDAPTNDGDTDASGDAAGDAAGE